MEEVQTDTMYEGAAAPSQATAAALSDQQPATWLLEYRHRLVAASLAHSDRPLGDPIRSL